MFFQLSFATNEQLYKLTVSLSTEITLQLTSHDILHYLCSADLSKSFSQLLVSIVIFSQHFFQ